jgi:hypothetical protein
MKKNATVISFLLLTLVTVPIVANAAFPDLIVCDPARVGGKPDCDFNSLLALFKVGVKALLEIASIITVIALIMIGFKFMTAQDNAGVRTEAKNQAMGILKGYFFILAAWLIVYTISSVLVKDSFTFIKR